MDCTKTHQIWTPIVESLWRQLRWLLSPSVLLLMPFSDFQNQSKEAQKLELKRIRTDATPHVPLESMPVWVMEAADRAYQEVIGSYNTRYLFGSNAGRHPERTAKWAELIKVYSEKAAGYIKALLKKHGCRDSPILLSLPDSIRYLLETNFVRRTPSVFGVRFDTTPPLLTPSFMKDLVYIVTPVNEKATEEVQAWKLSWTAVSHCVCSCRQLANTSSSS